MNPALTAATAVRHDNAGTHSRPEIVLVEAPVALVFNGQSPLVLMATPVALDDLITGWALSERVIDDPSELQVLDIVAEGEAWQVEASIPDALMPRLAGLGRVGAPNSACGLCGTERLSDAMRAPRQAKRVPALPWPTLSELQLLLRTFTDQQVLNQETGAAHAAAWVDDMGTLLREDIGRHNALDKLIGARARSGRSRHAGLLLMSSRASYELVHKAISAGISRMLVMSAPTSAAIALANQYQLELAAFTRELGFTHYAG